MKKLISKFADNFSKYLHIYLFIMFFLIGLLNGLCFIDSYIKYSDSWNLFSYFIALFGSFGFVCFGIFSLTLKDK